MSLGTSVAIGSVERILSSSQFTYSDLSSSVARFLRGQAERIRRQAASSIVNIGKDLIGAKHYLSHGAFIGWVENEVGIPARTAQAYMRVAKWASQKSATVAHLPPSLLYLLSASSTPDTYIVDILKRAEAGERISLRAVRDELREMRESRQEQRQGQAGSTLRHAQHETNSDTAAIIHTSKDSALLEAVAILARALSAPDFLRVREIMTRRSILDDPQLPQKIVMAFLAFERPTEATAQ
jgi:hypothetical protein